MPDLASKLHTYWKGENTLDSLIHGNDLNNTLSPTVTFTAGLVGNAWNFPAGAAQLDRSHASTVGIDPVAGESFSLVMYLRSASLLANAEIFSKTDSPGGAAEGWGFRLAGPGHDIPSFYYVMTPGGVGNKKFLNFGSGGDFLVSTWHTIIVVHRTGVGHSIYLDGVGTHETVNTGDLFASTHALNIGAHNLGGSYQGLMDGVAFYKNRGLTDADAVWMHNGGAGRSLAVIQASGARILPPGIGLGLGL